MKKGYKKIDWSKVRHQEPTPAERTNYLNMEIPQERDLKTITITAEYEYQEQVKTLLYFLHPITVGYSVEEKSGTKRVYITVVA